MAHPGRDLDDGHARANQTIGKAHPVIRLAEFDVLNRRLEFNLRRSRGLRGYCCLGPLLDFGDETKPVRVQRFDEFLLSACVPDSMAGMFDCTGNGRIRDKAILPDFTHKVLFADRAMPFPDQVEQKRKDQRFSLDRCAITQNFQPLGINLDV